MGQKGKRRSLAFMVLEGKGHEEGDRFVPVRDLILICIFEGVCVFLLLETSDLLGNGQLCRTEEYLGLAVRPNERSRVWPLSWPQKNPPPTFLAGNFLVLLSPLDF